MMLARRNQWHCPAYSPAASRTRAYLNLSIPVSRRSAAGLLCNATADEGPKPACSTTRTEATQHANTSTAVSHLQLWQLSLPAVLPKKSSISAIGVENVRGLVIIDFSGTVTSGAELPPLSVACRARDGVGCARHVGNSLEFGYLHSSRPTTFLANDFSLATTFLTGRHGLPLR